MQGIRNFVLQSRQEHVYERLGSTSGHQPEEKQGRAWPSLKIVFVAFFFGISGYLAGYASHTSHRLHDTSRQIPIGSTALNFKYNDTFTLSPSKHTNRAWKDLFPAGEGFIRHPQLSPNTSGIAVFHQLHCLDMLRVGYYQVHQSSSRDSGNNHEAQHEPAHTRHCFDYLRQSIMCAADETLEPVVQQLGGITGWGVERVCRNFKQLSAWAAEWKDEHPGERR